MKLTEKCLEDFYKWLEDKYDLGQYNKKYWFLNEYESFQTSEIIEFFDSVGIYISISADNDISELNNKVYFIAFVGHLASSQYNSRQEATNAAIEKANEIYNEKHN